MSVDAQRWVWEHDLPANVKFVAIALAHFAHPDGHGARPSQVTLARMTGISGRSIRRHLDDLERAGVISREIGVGRGRTTTYVIHRKVDTGGHFYDSEKGTQVSAFSDKRGQMEHEKGTTDALKEDTGVLQIERIYMNNENPIHSHYLKEIRSSLRGAL